MQRACELAILDVGCNSQTDRPAEEPELDDSTSANCCQKGDKLANAFED